MKSRIIQYSFLAIIVIFIAMICVCGLKKDAHDIKSIENTTPQFNKSESEYIEKHDELVIYVDSGLRYLMGDGDNGFLQQYINDIFSVADIDVSLTEDEEEADCRLSVITKEFREENKDVSYTSPVFQIEGDLFIREDMEVDKELTGILVADSINDDGENITYDGKKIDFLYCDENAENALKTAEKENLDFILGDRSAIYKALDGRKAYIPLDEEIYDRNVCFVTAKDDTDIYGVINKCVYTADRNKLLYVASQEWLDGNGPVYMKESYENIYMLILIIFTAVMIALYIYYHADKNLYDELNDRMEKLSESKKELKTTFNGVGYYLAELDLEGGIIDINHAFYTIISSDVLNRKIWDVLELDSENKDKLQSMVTEAGNEENKGDREIVLKRKILEIDIFPIENASGAVDKLLFMAEDVTSRRMAERQMLQDNKMIAVGQLAAGVAHEIRNPLGIIRNYCYVLKNMDDDSVKEKAIEHIEKAVDNSGAIINNLLNFSRVSVAQRETIDVEEHIRSLTSLNNNILKKKNINLDIICPEKVRTFILVESLDMILINLISNATDAMNDNGNLTIKVVKYKENFEIEVQDTGTGIDEDILHEIFNPFFTTKGNNEGNGLGLYIVYNETDKLNGRIEVQSKPGEGSAFKLTLPLREEDSREDSNG